MSTSASSIPSLCSCTPEQASKYLLNERFQGNATEAATFLLQAIDKLPNIDEINEAMTQEGETEKETKSDDESISINDLGLAVEKIPQIQSNETSEPSSSVSVSATVPRSKFTLKMFEKGCLFTNAKNEQISVSCDHVKHVIMFPKREDCLKRPKRSKSSTGEIILPGSMVLLVLEEGVTFRKKPLSQICIQLPQHNSDPIQSTNCEDLSNEELRDLIVDSFERQWGELFKSSFKVNKVTRVYNPKLHNVNDLFNFKSDEGDENTSISCGGMPFVKCYSGTNDGVLFPLEEGLLFFKPPRFIHRSELHSISCGRGSGGRFIDLLATLDNTSDEESKESLEFTNIDRGEAKCLNDYINDVLVKAMAKDAETDDDDTEDEGATSTDDEIVTKSRKRKSQRNASISARKATKLDLRESSSSDAESDEEYEAQSDCEIVDTDYDSESEGGTDTESD